jgi:hypothetical protein
MNTHTKTQKDRNHSPAAKRGGKQTAYRRPFAFLLTLAAFLAVIGLSSCAGYTSASTPAGGNPGTPGAGILTPSVMSFAFGNVSVGTNSTQTLTVTNTGTATVNIDSVTISGAGFTSVGASPLSSISVGQSGTIQIQFAPASAGAVTGSLTIVSNASNSPSTISLSGTGTSAPQPQLSANPTSASFGNVTVGNTNSQTITLSNSGNASVTITQANVTGAGYSTSGLSLPKTITAGGNTTFNAVFAPTTTGAANGSLSLVSNAPNSPLAINLSGTGVAASTLLGASPTSLTFGNVNDGSNSSLNVTLQNNGNTNVTISSVTVTGAGMSTSGVSSGLTLTPNQTATLSVTFAPNTAGAVSGSVTVASNATNSPATISVSGTGVAQSGHSVNLTWDASSSSGVTGYFVYRGSVTGGPYTKQNSTQDAATAFTDTSVTSGQTYFYVVTAIDSSNVESAFSNQVSATIP